MQQHLPSLKCSNLGSQQYTYVLFTSAPLNAYAYTAMFSLLMRLVCVAYFNKLEGIIVDHTLLLTSLQEHNILHIKLILCIQPKRGGGGLDQNPLTF